MTRVTPREQDSAKSIGRSTTMPQDITDFDCARRVLLVLAEQVGADARRHGKKGTTVQITIKYSDFTCITRQSGISSTYLTKDICTAGTALLKKNWTGRPVRLIGISVSGFADETPQQLSFFASDKVAVNIREEHLEKTVDVIRQRFGDETIKRASLIDRDKSRA